MLMITIAQVREAFEKARRLHGRTEHQGLKVSIENKRGTLRRWKNNDNGTSGATRMQHPYGYIRGTVGMDGEHLDCYVGPHKDASHAYVITQSKAPDFKELDEQKVMLGFRDADEAKAAYLQHMSDPRFFVSLRAMPMAEFRTKALATRKIFNTQTHESQLVKALPPGPKYLHYREHCWRCEAPFPWNDKQCKSCGRARKHMLGTAVEKSIHKDKLPGGLADKRKPSDFDAADLAEGVKIELEHTRDRSLAQEIAMDHLTEDPSYYHKLRRYVEKSERVGHKYTSRKADGHGGWSYEYQHPAGHTIKVAVQVAGYASRPGHDVRAHAEGTKDIVAGSIRWGGGDSMDLHKPEASDPHVAGAVHHALRDAHKRAHRLASTGAYGDAYGFSLAQAATRMRADTKKSLARFFIKSADHPPAGYSAVPNTKHGGFRKRTGDGYTYWYPSAHAGKPEHEHWDEKAFGSGSYDKAPAHWHFMRGPLGPVPWTAGGLDPHSQHPVKIAGDEARLYQIVKPEESIGWARLRDVHSGDEKIVAHDRVMPVEHHVGKGPAPRAKGPAAPAWDPGAPHEGKATGWVTGSAQRMQPFEQSTAKAGTILHNVERAHYPTKLMRRIVADASGVPHTTEVRAMAMPDGDKVKLIGEFDRMIKKVASRATKRFALQRTKEVDADMRSAAVEGMLHAIDTYHGGHGFLPHAEFMADQHARLHAAREFAGGLAMSHDHARLLQGFIAAQAEARRIYGKTPDAKEIASVWRIKKRDLHRGIETGRDQEIPMHPYAIKAGEITSGNEKPGKLSLAESYLEFLSGQRTAGGSEVLDEQVALLPGVGVGVGLSEHDRVIASEAIHRAFDDLKDHDVWFAQNTYRSNAGAILTRMLGLDMEPQTAAQIAREVPIYRIDRAGDLKPASQRTAVDVIEKIVESGLTVLRGKLKLGDEAGALIERAYRRVVRPALAKPGPTWFAHMQARAKAVTRDQVRAWRAAEREKLRKLSVRVASAGGPDAASRSAQLDKVRADLSKIGLRRARMLVAEQQLLSKPATRQWFASATGVRLDVTPGLGKEYTPITMTLTDPATGAQRMVKLRSVHDVNKSEATGETPDAGALHFAATFPRLARLLYASHDPEAWVTSPARLSLLEQIGCLEPEGE